MSILAHFEQYSNKTFRDARELYRRDFKGKDWPRVEAALNSVAPYIDDMRLITIDNDALETFKFERFHGKGRFADHKPAMAGTVNKELTQVVTVLQQATKLRRWLPSAPQILHVDGPVRRGYPFNYEEQDRIAWAMPTGWDVGVLCFAANTGARKEELFGLKWTDERVYEEEGITLFILRETKNGCVRALICNSIAKRCVEEQRRWQAKHGQDEYVFPRKMCPSANGKTWISAWTRAGMPADPLIKRGIHNCRHAYATRLRAVEIVDEDRDWLLGHNKTDISQLYALGSLITLNGKAELVTKRFKMLSLH
jgi:integrase